MSSWDVPILVQSMNLSRGTEVQQVLEVTNFSTTCSPFKLLTRLGFSLCIEEVRAGVGVPACAGPKKRIKASE